MKLHQKVFEFEMYQRRGRRMETLWIYYNDLFPNDVPLERKTEEQTGNKFRMINYIKFFLMCHYEVLSRKLTFFMIFFEEAL